MGELRKGMTAAAAAVVLSCGMLYAGPPEKAIREGLTAQIELVSPEALFRLADDWEKNGAACSNGLDGVNGPDDGVAELRKFAAEAAGRKKTALAAIESGDMLRHGGFLRTSVG